MNSSRSYVVNGLINWIVENNCTPHLIVDARCENVEVPIDYIIDGLITLNISGHAIRNFSLTPQGLSFDARFGGTPYHIQCPVGSIVGVYAKENKQGMSFEVEKESIASTAVLKGSPDDSLQEPKTRPHLRLVKE